MLEFFRALFGTDFMPHLYCLRGDPGVLWLSVVSDLAIALAYYAIPLLLFQVVYQRKDVFFRKIALLFVGFIAACGTTHLLAIWTIWYPMYRLEGIMKALTALISVSTAVVLVWLKPAILKLPSVAELEAEIAERRQAQEEARDKDERFRTYVEGVRDYAIYMINLGGVIQTWNVGAERIKGYKAEEIIGQHFSCFYTPEDREGGRPEEAIESATELGQSEQEGWRVRKDGSQFWAKTILRPSFDSSGTLRGFTKITRDLTESRVMEAKYQLILEAAPDAMVMSTPSGRIVYVNRQMEQMFGYSRAEILGKSVNLLIPERLREERARNRKAFFEARTNQQMGERGEYWCVRKDGTEFPVEASLNPLDTMDGPVQLASVRDVSERRQAAELVREKDERFRSFVDGVEDYAIYMIDIEGFVQTWNHGAERLKGYTAEEVVGRNFAEFYTEEDRELGKPQEALRIARETGRFEGEGWRVRKDGSQFLANVIMRALWDSSGALRGFSKVTRDLTESRQLEAKYQVLLEATPDAIVIVNSRGEVDFMNTQAETLFGFPRSEVIGNAVDMLVPVRAQAVQASYLARLLDGTKHPAPEVPLEMFGQRKDGPEFPLEFSVRPLATKEGQVLVFAVRDLTERRKTEARFRALLESAPDAMVISGSDGLIQLTNLEAERLFNYSREEMIGQPVGILIPADLHEGYERDSEEFFRGRGQRAMGVGVELRARRSDGTDFPVEIRFSPMEGPDGTSMTAAIRDISERHLAERQLAEKMAELRQSNEALEQFAHIASHDLQEPLRMVASYTQLLAKRYRGRLDADADEFIGYAVDGTHWMKRLIEDLLLYSRAGRGAPPMESFASERALHGALRNLRTSVEESSAVVTHDPLPTVVGDESQMVQIFQNLIGNAIKYRVKAIPQIHISASEADEEWVFAVGDNGIGIEPQFFERIFVIFQRLHGRGEYEGTGIGLAICKRILQQQGGRIWVESEPGKGSIFHFSLPMRSQNGA